eukprot:14163088-Alexandrium_andersonii.AAC.1
MALSLSPCLRRTGPMERGRLFATIREFWTRKVEQGMRPVQTWSNITNPILWALSAGERPAVSQLARELRWPPGPTEALFDNLERTWTRHGPEALAVARMGTPAWPRGFPPQ